MNASSSTANTRALIAVFICSFFGTFFAVSQPLLALMFETFPDIPTATVTMVATLPSAVSVVMSLSMGFVTAKVDKKILLLIGLALYVISTGIVLISGGASFLLLIASSVLSGFAYGILLTITNAQVSALSSPERRSTMIGINTAIGASGTMVFSFLGGVLTSDGNWVRAYAIGLAIIAAIVVVFFIAPSMKPTVAQGEGDDAVGSSGFASGALTKMVLVLVFYNLVHMTTAVMSLNYSDYIIAQFELGTSVEAGMAGTLLSLGGLLGGLIVVGIMSKIFKNFQVIVSMLIVALVVVLPGIITNSLVLMYVLIFLSGCFSTCCFSGSMALCSTVAGKKSDLAISLFTATTALALFAAPYAVNAIAGIFSDAFTTRYFVAAAFAVVGAVGMLMITLSEQKQEAVQVEPAA